jgi:hypothetical protein
VRHSASHQGVVITFKGKTKSGATVTIEKGATR